MRRRRRNPKVKIQNAITLGAVLAVGLAVYGLANAQQGKALATASILPDSLPTDPTIYINPLDGQGTGAGVPQNFENSIIPGVNWGGGGGNTGGGSTSHSASIGAFG